jgi:hypothetical protein
MRQAVCFGDLEMLTLVIETSNLKPLLLRRQMGG